MIRGAVVICGLVLVALLAGGGDGDRIDRPVIQSASGDASVHVLTVPRRAARRVGGRHAWGTAARFAEGLLRWEEGRRPPTARRLIARTATSDLSRFILAARPRQPSGAPRLTRGRVARIELSLQGPRRALATVAIRRGARTHPLLLRLARRSERWTVTDLG